MQRILFVGAHHDDLELGLGGSVKRWSDQGRKVFSAILTHSQWTAPDGTVLRTPEVAEAQCGDAAKLLGYQPLHLRLGDAFDLRFCDAHVVQVLQILERERVDTLIAPWEHDAHPAHRAASQIALAASRKVPNVLSVRISWNSVPQDFHPRYFVDVTDTLEARIAALRCYEDEWKRTGVLWERFVRSTAALYGLETGCEAAEGFGVVKLRGA